MNNGNHVDWGGNVGPTAIEHGASRLMLNTSTEHLLLYSTTILIMMVALRSWSPVLLLVTCLLVLLTPACMAFHSTAQAYLLTMYSFCKARELQNMCTVWFLYAQQGLR